MADEDNIAGNPEEEHSIEEILDSIRQIISDDDEAEIESAPDLEEEIINLDDPVDPIPEPEPEPDPISEPEPVKVKMQEPEPMPEPEPDFDDNNEDDDIFTELAESAAMEGFEKLVRKTSVEYNGITLEEIVRTELKPLLREWLDNNLPKMIERLVKEELQRVSKRVLDD